MTHIVIPAAGNGRRFVEAGYPPKNHVLVNGVPMLRAVVDNLRYVVAKDPQVTVVVSSPPPELPGDVRVVRLTDPTRGAAETVLRAGIDFGPLAIANCDQLITGIRAFEPTDGGVVFTFTSSNPHHSYVQVGPDGFIERIAEKVVISDQAVAGVYFFADARHFNTAARAVIARNELTLGEFYISTVLAEMVARGLKLRAVPCEVDILGTPEELEAYHARTAVTA